jgi:hypothetical protein
VAVPITTKAHVAHLLYAKIQATVTPDDFESLLTHGARDTSDGAFMY